MHMSSMYSDEAWSPSGAMHMDFRNLDGTTCYCDETAEKGIIDAIKGLPLNALHWIDGGDYHYLSALWLRRLTRPTRLVLIDNHPDDQEPAFDKGLLSCGGWIAHSRRTNPFLDDSSDHVYLSIDLDWLSPEFARTNWNQGKASLEDLLHKIEESLDGKELTAVDICGGITCSQGGRAEDFAINRRTRQSLQDYFKGIWPDPHSSV